ncbi:MAG: glycerol-3-phosphate dehydrogenase subunit GlpB [Prevotella sp.]|nr:glycerol-3-phosphate dehydrogenase subunit GlpB [Prevotella sp.]
MRYDIIIIGGGLSGLTAGITLAQAGKKVCIVSAGQSSLHFHSGSFDLLGYEPDGKETAHPLDAIARLNASHPYSKIGYQRIAALADKARNLLTAAGISVKGSAQQNHYRLTPLGMLRPAWLTTEGYATSETADALPWKSAELLNVQGFLDFPTQFIAANLKKQGVACQVKAFTTAELSHARQSPTEMRATNIAKVLADKDVLHKVADRINAISGDADVLLLPAVLGFSDGESLEMLKEWVRKPIEYIATLPPSVSGVRTAILLKRLFAQLGGTLLIGDAATEGQFTDNRLVSVTTEHLTDETLYADCFILASGSFMSHGLKSNYEHVFEPVFNLDVHASAKRDEWTREDSFDAQPYMEYGVRTDNDFHAMKDGKAIENLFAIGSVLGGHNSVKLADGTGVSLLTALQAAETIIGRR